jgi:serine/threonine protein kinase
MDITYCRGITGFVELHEKVAKKYSEFNQLYWLKEYSILFYLWQFKTDNIIKYQSSAIVYKKDAKTNILGTYHKWVMQRYPATLYDRKLYRDAELIQFLLDMTSALAFLHSKNIMHRDVKPQNIALTDNNRAVLIDFSHSHKMSIYLDNLDPQVVTYYYRAPEVFEYQDTGEHAYNNSIDIWSLGSIAIEIIAGDCFAKYYTGGIRDHNVGEDLYRGFVKNHKYLFSGMKEFYMARKREGFQHYKQYWTWISKMVAPDPSRRSTAAELYEEIITFAKMNKIKVVIPVNGVIEAVMIPPDSPVPVAARDNNLLDKCIEYMTTLRMTQHMMFNIAQIKDITILLIQQNEINEQNYKEKCAALAIIIATVLFDNVRDLEHYGILNNKYIKDAIIDIVQKYDQQLFGNNNMFKSMAVDL